MSKPLLSVYRVHCIVITNSVLAMAPSLIVPFLFVASLFLMPSASSFSFTASACALNHNNCPLLPCVHCSMSAYGIYEHRKKVGARERSPMTCWQLPLTQG